MRLQQCGVAQQCAGTRRTWHNSLPQAHRRVLIVKCSAAQGEGEASREQQPTNTAKTDDSTALLSSLSAVARLQGRTGRTNVVLASDSSNETWRKLDKRVNKYPGTRTFTAIGSGGDAFKLSMISAVESVVGSVHCECVSEKTSSTQKYISVTVGPVWVEDSEQVLEIYARMREDERLRFFI